MSLQKGGFQLVVHVCPSSQRPNPWCRKTTFADQSNAVSGASVLTVYREKLILGVPQAGEVVATLPHVVPWFDLLIGPTRPKFGF
ncbi:uncharacterized [Tachysurus ichikawai]